MVPGKGGGWYHYEWRVPGALLPRWKSSYVRLIEAPSGKRYVIGSGMYNDEMERAFVVDMVTSAVQRIEAGGETAYALLRDPMGPFMAKDSYVFVIDPNGGELVNPGFPNLEGRNVLDVKDTAGKTFVRDMMRVATTEGSGWVDYLWPRPGHNVSTQKSAYVRRARIGGSWVLVGSGVYLADAPTKAHTPAMAAAELMTLVRDGAALLAERGENAYPEFRQKGSRWFRDGTYFLVYSMSGIRVFHAANPDTQGQDITALKDVLGRPIGRAILDAATSPSGEGWVHYMYPEPGDLFPTWKSTFVTRVRFPSGELMAVGCGVYNMPIDRTLIQDLVDRAAALVAAQGQDAFEELRSRTGPFVFMDTYVFVDRPDGLNLVNPGQPSLEGTNLRGLQDLRGKYAAAEFIDKAMKDGSAWTEYYWYRPGYNAPARKETYVRKVQYGTETYIVGAGFYVAANETNGEQ
jgi:signal transduction histidine kinase